MKNACGPSGSSNCRKIISALFLIAGTGLTLLTHSDAGILGFFIAGAIFGVGPRNNGCGPCGGCGSCECCCGCLPTPTGREKIKNPVVAHHEPAPKKVTKPRKTTKKTA